MSDQPLIVFAGGGTGGHLFPALAVVEWFREHRPEFRFEFFCTTRDIDRRILNHWNVPFTIQPIQPFRRQLAALPQLYLSWRRSCRLCAKRFRAEAPAVVVGTGGYGSGPPVKTAARMGLPTALFNPDVIPGKANRFLARHVDAVWVQWAETRSHLPRAEGVVVTGCPVRRAFLDRPTGGEYKVFGLSPQRRTLLVTGASSGARSLNETLLPLAADLAQAVDWQVLHVSGAQDLEALRRAYENAGVPAVVLPFTDEMPAALRCADLAVGRAGAVTLAELAVAAVPAILLPYPYHSDNHQRANAEVLAAAGSAVIVEDSGDGRQNAPRLREVLLKLMNQPEQLSAMQMQAQQYAPAHAAESLSAQLLALAGKGARS